MMRPLAALVLLSALASRATADTPPSQQSPTTTATAKEPAATSVPATPSAQLEAASAVPKTQAEADEAKEQAQQGVPCLTPGRRALAIAAAIGPGLFVHGAGSYVAKRPRTAHRLLKAQVLGVGMIVAGGLPILATYGSPKVTVPGVALAVTGVGAVAAGWIGDIWAAAGGDVHGGAPRAELPRVVDVGLSWLRDDYHGNRGYLELGVRWQRRQLVVAPHARLGLGGRSGEGGIDVAWRFLGQEASGQVLERGHRLEARLGGFGRFDDDDEIEELWQEAELAGRLDLRGLDEALGGMFFEAGVGMGLAQTRYAPGTWDLGALLLARHAIGLYLGRGAGELSITYDQRRDDLVGGIFAGRAAGFLGHAGAKLELRLSRALALRLEAQLGTATMTTVTLRYGGTR